MNIVKKATCTIVATFLMTFIAQALPAGMDYGKMNHLSNEAALDEAIASGINIIVKCYASWCGPCNQLAPVMEKLATKYTNVLFIAVSTEEFSALCKKLGVRSIPTVIFYKNKMKMNVLVGGDNDWDDYITKIFN